MPTRYPAIDDTSLWVSERCVISLHDITIRASTAGGPGGQHANRSLTAVTVTLDVASAASLRASDRALLLASLGPVVRSSATRHRSQQMNRVAALEQLANKISAGLHRDPPRRATKPSKASQTRRLDAKKVRGRTKALRRTSDD